MPLFFFFLQLKNILMHELLAPVCTALNDKRVFDVTKFDVLKPEFSNT